MLSKNWNKLNKAITVISTNKVSTEPEQRRIVKTADVFYFDFSSTRIGQETDIPFETLKSLIPFIRYYQFFGFLPISISSGNISLFIRKPSVLWIFTGISLIIQIIMTSKAIRELVQLFAASGTVSEEVAAFNGVIYYVHIISMHLIMIKRLNLLPNFIEASRKVELLCRKYQVQNDNLVRHCWIVFGYFASSQLIGNALYYYAEVEKNNVTSSAEFSDAFSIKVMGNQIDKTGISGFVLSVFEFYCDCGWIFGDILIAVMSVMLTQFFLRLNNGISSSSVQTVHEIEELRKDHRSIKDLVEQCNYVFSPIILVNFVGNIGYLLTRLYTGLSDDLAHPKLIVRLESIYAFAYQITKILLPTWLAAILNETAHEPLDTVHDWPSLIHLPECKNRIMVIGRFISQLVHDPVGLSGCGYFTINKSFMVTLISGIMTYEVIILQFQQSGL